MKPGIGQFLIIGCLACAAFAAMAQSYRLLLPPGARVVLPIGNARQVFDQCSRFAPRDATAFWKPSDAELDLLELRLVQYLDSLQGENAPPTHVSYHRQYVGYVAGGPRRIYGNFYPGDGEMTERELEHAVIVCDIGPTHWGIVYDVETGRFINLAFTGAYGPREGSESRTPDTLQEIIE
jgi:hypothetical protein